MTHVPNQVPNKIPSAEPHFPDLDWILAEMRTALETGALTKGKHVKEFERLFAEKSGTKHAVALCSGTQALELVLRHYELQAGDEVIVPTNTFLASANAVLLAGGTPVFADIDASTLSMGLRQLQEQVTAKTRGVIVVHIGGLIVPDIEAIATFCKERGLFLLEDSSHAHGADLNGKKAGSFGDAGAFSLFPTKPMTTAEGGIITTNDDSIAHFSRVFRSHGTPEGTTLNEEFGSNYRMDELRAILGVAQTRHLDEFLAARRAVAERYEEAFAGLEGLSVLPQPGSSYYKFACILPTIEERNRVHKSLKEQGIDNGTLYWPPCHMQPVVKAHPERYKVRTPMAVAENVLPRVVCLPISAKLEKTQQDRVIDALTKEIKRGTSRTPSVQARPAPI